MNPEWRTRYDLAVEAAQKAGDLARAYYETTFAVEHKADNSPVTQHDVVPILLTRCTVCHGLRKQEGGLDLRSKASMLKGGKSGPAIVLGKPDDSLLIEQITGDKPEMPENEAPLSAAKVKLLHDWIAQGAKIDGAPKSEVPPVVIPEVYASAPAVS